MGVGLKASKATTVVTVMKRYYFDVVSLYPTVNALDRYPIGFGHYETYKTVDEFLFALKHDICFGLAKVHIVPPKNLYVPVLPDRSKGKLLFHLEPMTGTWTTIELKKALEKGYEIKEVYSVLEYDSMNGFMRDYVGNFLKKKIENSGVKTLEECNKINESHKKLGFKFEVKPENCQDNPGLRQPAKIC